jgi:predicted Fe-Mo cluster-binding NifX family protein
MKSAVAAQGPDPNNLVDPCLGRAARFIIYDTCSRPFDSLNSSECPGASQSAGMQAAKLMARRSVDVVVSRKIEPEALEVLQVVDMQMVVWENGTATKAIEPVRGGQRQLQDAPTYTGHAVECETRSKRTQR